MKQAADGQYVLLTSAHTTHKTAILIKGSLKSTPEMQFLGDGLRSRALMPALNILKGVKECVFDEKYPRYELRRRRR